ncbi:L,D-transpeptidase family protein [Oceanisphaera psychrotolerans]|uniref:L,D-transpeptidase family protein n=1 Tax=Oceanisphaera psychrotolerans TaxID=1414654 RepID=UPI001FDF0A40|nr:L,D-transpeptidase family protein [Oceanisphaera psychrotolerans]
MMSNKIKRYPEIIGLWLLLCVGMGDAAAASWQDEPEARLQLHQQGLELALADVNPSLTLWWQQAVSVDTASDEADDRLLLGMQAFWRHWASLSFVDRQYLRTDDVVLSFREQDRLELQLAAESGQRHRLVQSLAPGYSDHAQLQQQLARLLALNEQPWPALRTATLRPGERGTVVALIRERLELLGDMSAEAIASNVEQFDSQMELGVRRFQQRHGLQVDGVIGPKTFAWLDVSPLYRAQLLTRSMLRTLIGDNLPSSYLLVNIPEYRLRLYQNQAMVLESDVIVGRDKRKTPIMTSAITNVVFNPPWNVPRSIIEKDILPRLYRDPGYIERENFEVLGSGGRKVSAAEWQMRLYEGGGFPYRLRQRPGSDNALGAYKFHLPNDDAIYLHDTPARNLFSRDNRALSSGCVRVEGAEQLVHWLLSGQLGPERLAALKANRITRWIRVAEPLPVFMVYWPGWLGPDGLPRFRDDIYHFDRSLRNPFTTG